MSARGAAEDAEENGSLVHFAALSAAPRETSSGFAIVRGARLSRSFALPER
jgi:hypothetical protein